MTYELTEHEQQLKDFLNSAPSNPKFEIWQKVIVSGEVELLHSINGQILRLQRGQIVGLYFVSIAMAFDEVDKGWHYIVQSDEQHFVVYEGQITAA